MVEYGFEQRRAWSALALCLVLLGGAASVGRLALISREVVVGNPRSSLHQNEHALTPALTFA